MLMNGLSYQNTSYPKNLYLYNDKELQEDFDLDWYDYGARMYDPQLGRFHTIDTYSEKYYSMTNYQYGANNPIRYIDVNGDSIDIYDNNGRFLITFDDGNTEVIGLYFSKVKKDKNGNSKFSNGTFFAYNDAESDRPRLLANNMKVRLVTNSVIESAMEESEVNDQNENKWTYIERESRQAGKESVLSGTSSGKMDYFGSSSYVWNNTVHIVKSKYGDAMGYNSKDFGNFLWGHGGKRLGFDVTTLLGAAHVNNAVNGQEDNKNEPGYEHKILDSGKDQRAILNGFNYNSKPQYGAVNLPIFRP
jgi:RHS repeat-associated protein